MDTEVDFPYRGKITMRCTRCVVLWVSVILTLPSAVCAANKPSPSADKPATLWVLQPVTRPAVPSELAKSSNPIDAFIAAQYAAKGLKRVGQADQRTLLRRV
jgi:hypothetical protein